MTPTRLLWTGPFSARLRARAIEQVELGSVWVVATSLACDQMVADLTRRYETPRRPQVYCWDDLWFAIARTHPNPPALLSDASARSAVVAAIDRSRARDELGPLARVADLPGTRRQLRNRFASWTRSRRKPDAPAPRDDAITRAEWAVYRRYRKILAEHRAEDAAGLSVWAAYALNLDSLGHPRSIAFIDPIAPSPSQLQVIQWASERPIDMLVTLPTSGDLDGDDPAVGPLREALIDAGFEGEEFEPEATTGLSLLESSLFQVGKSARMLGAIEGLSIHGGPKGEGLGLLLAREVARSLDRGVRPDEILVLVRQWDDDATRALEILRDWGIACSGSGRRPLVTEPVIAALRLAMLIPVEGWESAPLIRLLRHGKIQLGDPTARAEAAAVIQSLRVFRGRDPFGGDRNKRASADRDRTDRARTLLGRLTAAIDRSTEETSWPHHVSRLRLMADSLGLGSSPDDRAALDSLWDILDEHTWIRDLLVRPVDHDTFSREVETILNDLDAPRPRLQPGTVRLATVDEAEGTSARVILLTNVSEGTFPTRNAVIPAADSDDIVGESSRFAVERLQFLHALGSARDEVILLVPTADEKGQDLLAAGFVDDVRRRLGEIRDCSRFQTLNRLDPTFREHPELARTAANARVLAGARACLDRETDDLLGLLESPTHREALNGAAAGLRLIHERFRVRRFTRYDGRLKDPRLVAKIIERFGPDHTFSPSQFESFALCPFQFYQKYVLKIAPVDDRPELRIDRADQGERIHKTLEEIHAEIQTDGQEVEVLGRIDAYIQTRMSVDLDIGEPPLKEVFDGLKAIEDEVVRRTLLTYRSEFAKYRAKDGLHAHPHRFEWNFGVEGDPDSPELVLGDDGSEVRLRGKIDRIDTIETASGVGFRVIDYKTGPAPSGSEVTKHLRAVQLPLYALAVEHLLFDDSTSVTDFGYWSVRRKGFEKVSLAKKPWPEFRKQIVAEILRLASILRNAEFSVNPQKKECTRSCDYKTVCRIGQIRVVEKEVGTISLLT